MVPQRISLAIFGNQNSNSGFQPLFWLNDPPQQLENLVPPGMEDNSYFYVLQTAPAFTQFTLVQNHVSSYMSSRAGVLKMAIAIPQGYRLAGDATPLSVLLAVRQLFIEKCMTQKSTLTESYNFRDKLVPPDDFAALIDSYALEPAIGRPMPMAGNSDALLLLDEEHTAMLFNDPHYAEFVPYRQIVIAPTGNTTAYQDVITGLEIPRRVQLRLVVNGSPAQWPVADYYNDPTTISLNLNPRCWTYTPLTFTVNQLMQQPVDDPANGHHAYIDGASESVVCTITPQPRKATIKVLIEGHPNPAALLPALVVQVGPQKRRQPLTANGTFQLAGDDIIYVHTRELKPVLNSPGYEVTQSTLRDNQLVVVVRAHQLYQQPVEPQPQATTTAPALIPGDRRTGAPFATKTPDNDKRRRLLPWLIAGAVALILIVAGLIFLLWPKASADGDLTRHRINNTDTDTEEVINDVETEALQAADIDDQMREYRQLLDDPDLTFAQVDKMAEWLQDEHVKQLCDSADATFAPRVENYREIIKLLLNNEPEKALSIDEEREYPLYLVHRWYIRAGVDGWVDDQGNRHMYQAESKKNARREFSQNCKELKSFKDIHRIHETGRPKVEDTTQDTNNKSVEGWPRTEQAETPQDTHRTTTPRTTTQPKSPEPGSDDVQELNE